MKKILVLDPPEEVNGVSWWRKYRPFALMLRKYQDIEIRWNRGQLFESDFLDIDIAIAFRPSNPDSPMMIGAAKKWGCKIILDYDDDLLNIPVGSPNFNKLYGGADCVNNCIAMADEIWASTQALVDTYKAANVEFLRRLRQANPAIDSVLGTPRFTIIPNAVLPSDLPDRANGNTGFVVWRGSDFHRDDLEMYRDQYAQILRNVKAFQWVGYMPTWAERNDHKGISYKLGEPVMNWFNYLRSLRISIVWKPLVNNQFNKGKSNISWLEATCAGGICLTNFAGQVQWEYATASIPKFDEYYVKLWQQSADAIRQHYDLWKWNEVRYRQILKLSGNETETAKDAAYTGNGAAIEA